MQNATYDIRSAVTAKRGRVDYFPSVSPAVLPVEEAVAGIASSQVSVLFVGERGSGKRTLAYHLHELSARKDESLEELTCKNLDAETLPGILSGNHHRPPGTLLLTEITELQPLCQSALFTFLSGHQSPSSVRPRLLATTHRSVEQEIHAGRFREDLYYWLAGICLLVPPLRHRREDIPGITDFFLRNYSALFGRPQPPLGDSTRRFLAEYSWPGNLAELEASIKTIAAIGDERIAMTALRSSMTVQHFEQETSLKQAARAASRQAERELILKVLTRTRWNRKRAAEEMHISYKALLYKLKQIGLDNGTKSCADGEDV